MKSEVTFKVNGVDRGFKFGTYTARLIEEKSGDKLSLFLEKMSGKTVEKDEHGGVEVIPPDLESQSKFYFCCALHWAKSNKISVDFDQVDVDDWRDELGVDKVSDLTADLFNQYSLKNALPPMAGETTE